MASAVQDRDATTLRRTEAEIDSTSGFNFGARGEKKFVQVEADEGEEKKKLWLIENLEKDKLFFIQLSGFFLARSVGFDSFAAGDGSRLLFRSVSSLPLKLLFI